MTQAQALIGYLDCPDEPGNDKVSADRDKPNV